MNVGPGAFQVYGYGDGNGNPDFGVVQEIWDGTTWVAHATNAGMFEAGDGHDHRHVREFESFTLTNDNTDVLGLSPGWRDEYPSTVTAQYIDITGLPNGSYTVTVDAHPHSQFLKTYESNNSNWARINITRKGVHVRATASAPSDILQPALLTSR